MDKNGIEIDFVCTAREAGAVKPNPRIYRVVLERFGIKPEETMMVGDDIKTDILPAKALGMKAVLLSRMVKTARKDADHVVLSLAEIMSLLK